MIPIVIIILLVHFALLVAEAYYDTIVHKAKTDTNINKRKKYAQLYHILQPIIFFSCALYGFYYGTNYDLKSITTLAVILNYVAMRKWIFNPIYNSINDLERNYLSSSESFDSVDAKIIKWVASKTSIKNLGIVQMLLNIIEFVLFFLSCIYLINNL